MIPQSPFTFRGQKINFEKVENFSRRICCRSQPRFHHKFTTIYHAKNHVLHTEIRKTPSKNAIPSSKNAIKKKKTPKPFCGPGAIGLQAARKPNSVLDDHSSTRRITAAL
jgi:membrane-associated HD superfamily phosphohydrolase